MQHDSSPRHPNPLTGALPDQAPPAWGVIRLDKIRPVSEGRHVLSRAHDDLPTRSTLYPRSENEDPGPKSDPQFLGCNLRLRFEGSRRNASTGSKRLTKRACRLLRLELLEDRMMLSSYSVTSDADTDTVGTLRLCHRAASTPTAESPIPSRSVFRLARTRYAGFGTAVHHEAGRHCGRSNRGSPPRRWSRSRAGRRGTLTADWSSPTAPRVRSSRAWWSTASRMTAF